MRVCARTHIHTHHTHAGETKRDKERERIRERVREIITERKEVFKMLFIILLFFIRQKP